MANIFERVKQGVKTTFHIKDLTPEQKAEKEQQKTREQAYKQEISEIKKKAWKETYEKEQSKAVIEMAMKEQEKSRILARMKAQQEVEAMMKPRKSFFGQLASGIGKVLPPQQQVPLKKGQKRVVPVNAGMWDIPLGQPSFQGMMFGASRQPKKQKMSAQDTWMSRELGGIVPYSASRIEHRLKHKKHHLKHLGTQKGGVSVIIDGTQITLAKPQSQSGRKRVRHLKLKHKLRQTSQPYNDMIWRL